MERHGHLKLHAVVRTRLLGVSAATIDRLLGPQRRLSAQLPRIRQRISAILALAEELKGGTIETVLGKSDLEVGLEFLLGKRRP